MSLLQFALYLLLTLLQKKVLLFSSNSITYVCLFQSFCGFYDRKQIGQVIVHFSFPRCIVQFYWRNIRFVVTEINERGSLPWRTPTLGSGRSLCSILKLVVLYFTGGGGVDEEGGLLQS